MDGTTMTFSSQMLECVPCWDVCSELHTVINQR